MSLPRLGLLAGLGDTRAAEPLVVACRQWCRPHAVDTSLGAPDAYLATDPDATGLTEALRGDIPVAVVVAEPHRLDAVALDRAAVFVVPDPVTADALGERAVIVERGRLAAADHPPLTPFVRSRWRTRLGLPEVWVLHIGAPQAWAGPDSAIPAALAVCSAAAVRGPWLLTALALGTPTVTDEASARSVGAVANVHVAVSNAVGVDPALSGLVADPARAAAIGWGGRLLVEEHHDLAPAAREILDRLGIGPAAFPAAPLASLDEELAALGTPGDSPVAARALRRAAGVAGNAPWESLTGRRR